MQHLFYVHSSITRLVAEAIIRHESLPAGAVYFLTDRGVAAPGPAARTLDVSDWTWRSLRGIRHNYAQLRRLDAFLERTLSGPFRFYPPHHITPTPRAVLSHPLAQSFAYAEEGVGSYSTVEQLALAFPAVHLDWSGRLAQRLKFRGRIAPRGAFFQPEAPRFHGAYALHAAAFPGLPTRTVLPLPFPVDPTLAHIRHVWTPSPLAEFRVCSEETQLKLTGALIRYLIGQGVQELHIKYHPRQLRPDGSAPAFRALFTRYADRLRTVELVPETSLESLAVSSEAVFYTGTSSAGFYALLCGRRVASYAHDIVRLAPKFQASLDRMPAHFTQHVDHLQLPLV